MSSQTQSLYYRERAIALAKAGLNVRAFRGAAILGSYGVVNFFHYSEEAGWSGWSLDPQTSCLRPR
jgi:hypothetical protein